jgi:hypothetical protein
VVFIGPIDSMEGVGKAAEKGNWSKGEVFQPLSLDTLLEKPTILSDEGQK